MTIEAASEVKTSTLSSKQKRKISRMEEKIRSLIEERRVHEQKEMKLNFKVKKISKERELLLGKIGEKDSEARELNLNRDSCGEKLLENDKPLKKFIAAFTFKSRELEEVNDKLKREIFEIEKKVEKISLFIDKHKKKEEKLTREIDEISKELELIVTERKEVEGNLEEAEKLLREIAAY